MYSRHLFAYGGLHEYVGDPSQKLLGSAGWDTLEWMDFYFQEIFGWFAIT